MTWRRKCRGCRDSMPLAGVPAQCRRQNPALGGSKWSSHTEDPRNYLPLNLRIQLCRIEKPLKSSEKKQRLAIVLNSLSPALNSIYLKSKVPLPGSEIL